MSSNIGLKNGIKESDSLYGRAKKVIASGTNTFSRAPGVFPDGASPKFLERQFGSHTWDVDGNEYIDMVMGCGPVTIGHNHPDINNAIKAQMDKGILFSMLNPLEVEVAEKLVDCIPCAEMVKFSKNGSDVCAASIKIARHVTKRDMIFCWGYHGFADWYIATTDSLETIGIVSLRCDIGRCPTTSPVAIKSKSCSSIHCNAFLTIKILQSRQGFIFAP